jgi:hypothetical protein
MTMLNLSDYQVRAIEDGYRFECPCGELLNSVAAAITCKKCRKYAPDMVGKFVIDISTGECVHGSLPKPVSKFNAAIRDIWEPDHKAGLAGVAAAIANGELK